MKVGINWQGDVHFVGTNASDHQVPMDGPPENGGKDRGSRPLELMLMGLGGCTAYDVVDILRKGRQKVDDLTVSISAERAASIPAVFENISVHFTLTGNSVDPGKVARAIELTAEKYCSASIMLERAGVAIAHTFEIIESNNSG